MTQVALELALEIAFHLLSKTPSGSNHKSPKCVLLIFLTALLNLDHIWSRHVRGHVVPPSLFTWTNRYGKTYIVFDYVAIYLERFPQQFARAFLLAFWSHMASSNGAVYRKKSHRQICDVTG